MAGLLALTSLAVANGVMAASTVTFGGLGGNNGDAFSSYSEAGFNVSYNSGSVLVGQSVGNALPSLFGESAGSILVTASAGLFSFDSIDLAGNNGDYTYTIVGKTGGLSGTTAFTLMNTLTGDGSFSTIGGNASLIDTLLVSVTPTGTTFNIDNIGVTATVVPVPAAVWLFGSGLLGLAGIVRKRA
jgi:hypothetical protein